MLGSASEESPEPDFRQLVQPERGASYMVGFEPAVLQHHAAP